MSTFIKFGIGVVLCTLLLNGAYDLFYRGHPNKCEMTYMFQFPEFIKIALPSQYISKHNYSLFAYGEDLYAEDLAKGHFKGIPVLFIPGNAGSYKQVRSLASVAYRKWQHEKHGFHFDFFSIDFNEELSAFFGPVLDRQTQFVGGAIRQIFTLYRKAKRKPSSIILVGHSLGGLVARAVVMLPEVPASQVPLIISEGTPHLRPVIVPDQYVADFYNKVNIHWNAEKKTDFKDIILVSIGGGRNDIQVPSHFTYTPFADVDTTMLSVPSCWLSTDHLAVVWCKQLVLAIARALFKSIDPSSYGVSSNRTHVLNAFKYQLIERSASKHSFPPLYHPVVLGENEMNGNWFEVKERQHNREFLKPSSHIFMMIPIGRDSNSLTIIGREIDWKNWVFACEAHGKHPTHPSCVSSSVMNLSPFSHVIPGNKKEVNIDLKPLLERKLTHVVVWIHPNDDKINVAYDMSDSGSRHKNISAPQFISSLVITEVTPAKALSFNLTIEGITEFWHSYLLTVIPNEPCTPKSPSYPHLSVSSSWNPRWEYLMNNGNPYEFNVEVDVPYTNTSETTGTPELYLHIILYQNCNYKISLQKSIPGIFKRMTLLYGLQLPAYLACHFLLVLSIQLKSLGSTRKCSSVFSTFLSLSPIVVVPFVKMVSFLSSRVFGIDSDSQILDGYSIDLAVLPIVLFLAFLPVSFVIASLTWLLVIGFGKATHSFAVRLLRRAIRTGDILTEIAVIGFWKVPAGAAIVLLALGLGSCGAFSLLMASVIYFIKVFKMYEDYLESFLFGLIRRRTSELNRSIGWSSIHIHFTLLVLSTLVTVLNIPTLITWMNIRENLNSMVGVELPADPSLVPCLSCLTSFTVLWQIKTLNPYKVWYKELAYLLHLIAILTVAFGSVHLYRISWFISLVFVLVAAHQFLAPVEGVVVDPDDSPSVPDLQLGQEETSQQREEDVDIPSSLKPHEDLSSEETSAAEEDAYSSSSPG